jgi:chromosome segregation ATPase
VSAKAEGTEELRKRIEELEKEIEELQARWPAHSVKPAMLMQLEELEAELERLRKELKEKEGM